MDINEVNAIIDALFDPLDLQELLHGRPGVTYRGLLHGVVTNTEPPYASRWPSDGTMTRQRRRAAERQARKAARTPAGGRGD